MFESNSQRLPTQVPTQEFDDVLAEIENLSVVEIANAKSEGDLRVEPRFNANTGNLRGIAFRERNKERKVVYYVGQRSKGDRKIEFEFYANAYREAKRERTASGNSVGNPVYHVEEIGKGSVGTDTNWRHSEGRDSYVH